MQLWKSLLVFLVLSISFPAATLAQSPTATGPSLAGEWRVGSWVVVIEQKGMNVRGDWKQSYRDKEMTCSGVWFEGTISGDRISGSRHPCGGRPQVLDMKIVDANTLEITTIARGGTPNSQQVRRIK